MSNNFSHHYIGIVTKVNNDFTAEINIFSDSEPLKNCKYYGFLKHEVKVGDQVFVTVMSRELRFYSPIANNPYIGISNGNSKIDLSGLGKDNNNTITIKADNVIIDSPNIKIGSNNSSLIPITKDDIPQILVTGSAAGLGIPFTCSVSFPGVPLSKKVKVE
jgi:hypothetical protein